MPLWLEKWTALILDFIEEEQSLLPSQLLSLRLPAPSFAPLYTPAGAVAEAKGVFPLAVLTTADSPSCTKCPVSICEATGRMDATCTERLKK